jgi:hypothetical protein
MSCRFRGIFRRAIAGVMALAIAQNLFAWAMCDCNCPCCARKSAEKHEPRSHDQAAKAGSDCCRAEKERPCRAESKMIARQPPASSIATLKAPPCRCDMRSAPAQPATDKVQAKNSAEAVAVAGVWISPNDVALASPEHPLSSTGPPYPGPSLQCLLCIWRK